LVVRGGVASVDLVASAVVLTTGQRIVVPAGVILPQSAFASLAALSAALSLGTQVEAEARVVQQAGILRAQEITFRIVPLGA
jgi:hypothetical protein